MDQHMEARAHSMRFLPRGGMLPREEWDKRHKALLVFLWANAFGLTGYGALSGYGLEHSALHGSGLFGFAILAMVPWLGRVGRSICVSLGLLTAAALLVHITHGVIEAHFYFFVIVVALTLYEDWLPFLLAVAYVLLHHGVVGVLEPRDVFNHAEAWEAPWAWAGIHALFVAGAGVAGITAWRLNENVRERMRATQAMLEDAAMVDSLTGLPNRRQLMADLDRLAGSEDGDRMILGMFDLDGFKTYNDTFGHAAGDTLLARLGSRLAASVPPPARAYRLGGDEFCVLGPAGELESDVMLARANRALTEHGEGFDIGCSHGGVVMPDETTEVEEALQIADRRMYFHKTGGRPSAGRQVGDALLRALEERDPDLGEHLDGVAVWSEAVARHLGLEETDVVRVRQAAELHDIGKVAIPDAILRKPGALDAEERAFIERHTMIGERIVGAAPALNQVAGLIRASHEWVDGNGYPDGLAGDEIPLGARIIAVCDAYDAMVTERPYRPGVKTPGEAIAELHRCAGTQFDPRIVSAFLTVMAERHAAADSAATPA